MRRIVSIGNVWPSGRGSKKLMYRRAHLRKLQLRIEKRRLRQERQRKRQQRQERS